MINDTGRKFSSPAAGQTVTRFDSCPCYSRRPYSLSPDSICWFCKYAGFDMLGDELPESGQCRHPIDQYE